MTGPHQDQPLRHRGPDLDAAIAAAILLHGRGATAHGMLQLADELGAPDVAYLAPQAAGNEWYPHPFTAPVEQNEPARSSGLQAITAAIEGARDSDIPMEKIAIVGFSQGACLASEYVARNPTRYGGLAALSGGLIGETVDPEDYAGDLDATPVFLGCSTRDPHIPAERVDVTAEVFERLGGDVTERLYQALGHGVNQDELDHVSGMLTALTG